MTTDSEVLGNFDKRVFYHGTSLKAAESIARDGFRVWFQDDEIGRYAGGGNLGIGIYITCDWRIALWFGPALLRVTIRPGTRLLNAALPPDGRIVDYLQREFGREVLKKAPWKVIPGNKKLTLRELIALFRYHYRHTWEKEYSKDRDGFPRWPMRRELHSRMLGGFKSLLIRYGFAGYGNPSDDNGIVIFAEDRLVLKEVVAEIPDPDYEASHRDGFGQFKNIDEVKKFFHSRGSLGARELAAARGGSGRGQASCLSAKATRTRQTMKQSKFPKGWDEAKVKEVLAHSVRLCALFGLVLIMASSARAGGLDIRLEGGGVWFSRNDVRIPGDDGTKFDMLDLTGKGPDPYIRIYATYDFNDRHALRLTFAPLEVEGTGRLSEDVTFKGDVFTADTPTKGKYKFNTYRLTYRWSFYNRERWRWGLGAAALVRDAEITLEQGDKRQSKDDLGLVPLLHLYGEFRLNDQASVILDVEGAWSPMGRAVDAALTARYDFDSGWYLAAGYRTLEGGADNDEVYTFAWLHYAQATVGYRF